MRLKFGRRLSVGVNPLRNQKSKETVARVVLSQPDFELDLSKSQ
jgi:hypothetical protein